MTFTFFDLIYCCGEKDGSYTDGISALVLPIGLALSFPFVFFGDIWIYLPIAIIWKLLYMVVRHYYNTKNRRVVVLRAFKRSRLDNNSSAFFIITLYWMVIPLLVYMLCEMFRPA